MGIDLTKRPDNSILFCLAPTFAKYYGALPVSLENENTLHVVATPQLTESRLEELSHDTCLGIVVDESITQEDFDKTYKKFYAEFI